AIALRHLAEALTAIDPDRAEATARTIADPYEQSIALSGIAGTVAAIDFDRAEAIARTIADLHEQGIALSGIAETVAATDPDRAEAIARTIADPYEQATALTKIAAAMAVRPVSVGTSARAIRPPTPSAQEKVLLACAWSISKWTTPVAALVAVDIAVAHALASDVLEEEPPQIVDAS
ncbi:hypothetical protein, partial [Nocardia sp. NPDC057353]|uniref:hypothetical protein n=1 Tax=Nocardia sp. NPDC057353 TaxID=3346104 RepID=UPI0036390A9E